MVCPCEEPEELITRFLWDNEAGMYFDYDFVNRKRHGFLSATTFYPLWAKVATAEQAELLVRYALPLLEMPGGLAGSSEKSRGAISERRPPGNGITHTGGRHIR